MTSTRNAFCADYEIGMHETSDKTARWRDVISALARKFGGHPKAMLWLGDQVTDFPILDRKGVIVRAMSQKDTGGGIGATFFVLPNPMYGNWMDNPAN